MLIEYRSTSNNNNNFMQQQALIMETAKDVPKQNFSIEKAKLHYLPSTNYVYHKNSRAIFPGLYSINHRNDIKN